MMARISVFLQFMMSRLRCLAEAKNPASSGPVRLARTRIVSLHLAYATDSDTTLPPDHGAQHGGDQRHKYQDDPSQPAQRFVTESESERLGNLGRDTDQLFPAQKPVQAA